jgi:hypothetical protein
MIPSINNTAMAVYRLNYGFYFLIQELNIKIPILTLYHKMDTLFHIPMTPLHIHLPLDIPSLNHCKNLSTEIHSLNSSETHLRFHAHNYKTDYVPLPHLLLYLKRLP